MIMDNQQTEPSTDLEQLPEEPKSGNNNIMNALLIGFLIGVLFMGAAAFVKKQNVSGIISILISLFLIYKISGNSKKKGSNESGQAKEIN